MRARSRRAAVVALAATTSGLLACGDAPSSTSPAPPLADPIPEKVAKSDIAAAALPFAQLPSSIDWPRTDEAAAGVQSMQPIPDGSGRLAVADQRGILYVTNATGEPLRTYLDLRRQNVDFRHLSFERGFMGFAFHPQFGKLGAPGYGKLYTTFDVTADSGEAHYLDKEGPHGVEVVIREWRSADPPADVFHGTSREVLRVGQRGEMHGFGDVAFNPTANENSADYGLLYVGVGDGADTLVGQNLGVPLAAILRIDPLGGRNEGRSYGIPTDNPFVDTPGAAAEIWAYGLRHPQRFSWDSDGRLFIADIGDRQIEEVNLGVAGGNYGWRLREGTFATKWGSHGTKSSRVYERPPTDGKAFVYPVAQYDRDEGFAIAGGFVYRGKGIPELRGKYVFTDIVRGRVFLFDAENLQQGRLVEIEELRLMFDGEERDVADVAGFVATRHYRPLRVDLRLGIDGDGELYLLTKGDGRIRKLVAPADGNALSESDGSGWQATYRHAYLQARAGTPVFREDWDVYRNEDAIVFVDEACRPGGLNRKPEVTVHAMDTSAAAIPPLTRFAPGVRLGEACVWQVELPDYAIAQVNVHGAGWLNEDAFLKQLRKRYRALAATPPTARSTFDLYVEDGELTYVKAPCSRSDIETPFFLHVVPADIDDLPSFRRQHGFENLDFRWGALGDSIFEQGSSTACMAIRELPTYAIERVTTGQYLPGETGLWRADINCSASEGVANPCG